MHHAVDAAQRRTQSVGLFVADHRGLDARRTRQAGHRCLASHHGEDAQLVPVGEPRQQRLTDRAVGASDGYLSVIHARLLVRQRVGPQTWNRNTGATLTVPPSAWNGARLPEVVHTARPFQPASGSSMRPSRPLP